VTVHEQVYGSQHWDKKRGLGEFLSFTPIPDIVGPISYSGEADEWLHPFGRKPLTRSVLD